MAQYNRPAFILKLKLIGERRCLVRPVMRIKLDAQGRILYWDAETGNATAVDTATLESVLIQLVAPARKAA